MPSIKVYYHDPVEVNPVSSWTGLSRWLPDAERIDIRQTTEPSVTSLFGYARPDAVVVVDGAPVVAIEQTNMNPSGHNIPQRFSCLVRAAEVGVPGILYYPEFSRRTFSDPNVRYLQVRVPLAQERLTRIYNVPSLSVFWPTDSSTKLPTTVQAAHTDLARIVDALIEFRSNWGASLKHPVIEQARTRMCEAIAPYANRYPRNASVRRFMPDGYASVRALCPWSVDPPNKAQLVRTEILLSKLGARYSDRPEWGRVRDHLARREFSLVFTGTLNQRGDDSEHPWPGYLTLLDILYTRSEGGRTTADRDQNLIYALPTAATTCARKLAQLPVPTPTRIVYEFADLLCLSDGLILGKPAVAGGPTVLVE